MVARKITQEQIDCIPARYLAGESTGDLARAFGCCRASVRQQLAQAGIARRKPLLDAVAGTIAERYVAGENSHELARAYGVTHRAILLRIRAAGVSLRGASEAHRHLPLRQDAFAVPSPERNYWAGFLMADGCVCGNEITLRLASVDEAQVLAFREFAGSGHTVMHIARNGYDGKTAEVLTFRSSIMAADLAKLGIIPRKSLVAEAPSELAMDSDFWRGAVDGDGWLGKKQCAISFCGGRGLVGQFASFCRTLSRSKANVNKCTGKQLWTFSVTGRGAIPVMAALYGIPSGPALARKKEIAMKFLEVS